MTEKRKSVLTALLPVMICLMAVTMFAAFCLREYQNSAFRHLSKFCEAVIENQPEAEKPILMALKEYGKFSPEEIEQSTFLAQNGYDRERFFRKSEGQILFWGGAVCLAVSGGFLFSLWCLEKRKRARIAELTNDLEEINLGIREGLVQVKEDAFSRLQDELYKTVTELYQTREAAVKAKTGFADNLANIAHQLKTSVTAASLSLQLAEKEMPGMRVVQIRQQLERLGALEESLLTLSQIDAGTLQLERSEVDLYTALTLASENLEGLLQEENISVEIPDRGRVEITGDMEWTMEALLNLMKNCMEHSPKGGTIHCDYSGNPIYAGILIWDEGEGFCQEDLPHLFERFYRGKKGTSKGIGIGLSMAKSIFELQNGNITARNLPGGGACFEIRVYSH